MNPTMRRRLANMEAKFCPHEDKSGVVFFPLNGETESEFDERVERWKAGEKVEGQECPHTGPNQLVMRVVFVDMDRKFAVLGQTA